MLAQPKMFSNVTFDPVARWSVANLLGYGNTKAVTIGLSRAIRDHKEFVVYGLPGPG